MYNTESSRPDYQFDWLNWFYWNMWWQQYSYWMWTQSLSQQPASDTNRQVCVYLSFLTILLSLSHYISLTICLLLILSLLSPFLSLPLSLGLPLSLSLSPPPPPPSPAEHQWWSQPVLPVQPVLPLRQSGCKSSMG